MQEEIKILYTSDIHGHVMPINYGTNEEEPVGLTKYATIVKKMRKTHKNLLIIDNGDLIQGTPFMTNYVKKISHKENPIIHVLNKLQVDAGVLGNHEFNFGKDIIRQAVDQAHFPYLSANIIHTETGQPAYGPPYIIKEFSNGIKIAIIGVTTHYIPHWESPEHIEGLEFADAYLSLKQWVTYVKNNEKADIIIASYHGGLEADIRTGEPIEELTGENQGYKMAKEIDDIDVLLTGHQHQKQIGQINDCLIIQPGKHGMNYGEITLQSSKGEDGKWKLLHKEANIRDFENIPTDQAIYSYLEPIEKSTQKWLDQPVGTIRGDMSISNPFQARVKKHPFIQLIQNVQLEASGADISVTSLLNDNSDGFPPNVTTRDIISNFMYPNTLVVLELTGADIKEALEQSATYFILNEKGDIDVNPSYVEPKPQHYNYDMWEGIDYTIHVSQPVGQKVKDIYYKNEPLEQKRSYHVVLNNYRAAGGGNFKMFLQRRIIKEIPQDAVQLIQHYFKNHPIIEANVKNNFRVKK